MRRFLIPGLLGVSLALAAGAVPVAAADRHEIEITATTTFDDVADTFAATGIAGCATGVVENGPSIVRFTPGPGVYAGFKVFTCDGSAGGFVLRLNARFGPGGSTGTWSVVDTWGDVGAMAGAGRLRGDPIDNGIVDRYEGTVTG